MKYYLTYCIVMRFVAVLNKDSSSKIIIFLPLTSQVKQKTSFHLMQERSSVHENCACMNYLQRFMENIFTQIRFDCVSCYTILWNATDSIRSYACKADGSFWCSINWINDCRLHLTNRTKDCCFLRICVIGLSHLIQVEYETRRNTIYFLR